MSDMIYFKTLIIEDKPIDKKTIEGKCIVFGKNLNDFETYTSEYVFQEKINDMFENLQSAIQYGKSYNIIQAYNELRRIENFIECTLSKYGVTCEFNDEFINDCGRDYNTQVNIIFESEENLVKFIFNEKSKLCNIDDDYYYDFEEEVLNSNNKIWSELVG